MEKIKGSFFRVKQDINTLNYNINGIKNNLDNTRKELIELCDIMKAVSIKNNIINELDGNNSKLDKRLENKTNIHTQKDIIETNYFDFKTIRHNIKPRNDQILPISIGNEGGQTDRQTDRQTDNGVDKSSYNQNKKVFNNNDISQKKKLDAIDGAIEILDSLDSIKKEIRIKFKRLTNQEILVFSTIYQLEEEFGSADYKTISKKINLTESSIRDYVRRLIVKGIPIIKEKVNNKEIKISISQNLKKIATLSSILELRDI